MKRHAIVLAAAAFILAACGGQQDAFGGGGHNFGSGPRGMHGDPTGTASAIKQLLRYDANKDGAVTRVEMEAGLKADFDALDKTHTGKLDADETRAENERRYKQDSRQYSPLIDWNQDGEIDFGEFAGTLRSMFDELDHDHDDKLSPSELRTPQGPTLEEPRKRGGHGDQRGGN